MNPDDTLQHLPCAEALVAGTVAAMTAWADPCPGCTLSPAAQRAILARKLVANLLLLQQHPGLSPELRQVMAMACRRWQGVLGRADLPAPAAVPAPPAGTGAPRWH